MAWKFNAQAYNKEPLQSVSQLVNKLFQNA